MTNVEYEERQGQISAPKDPALREIASEIWLLYDDNFTHRMTGTHRLTGESRRGVARAVLFLHSDCEYGWPETVWDGSVFLITAFLIVLQFALLPETSMAVRGSIGTVLLGLWVWYERKYYQKRQQQQEKAGDVDAWPFLRRAELDEAVRSPRLLSGTN